MYIFTYVYVAMMIDLAPSERIGSKYFLLEFDEKHSCEDPFGQSRSISFKVPKIQTSNNLNFFPMHQEGIKRIDL